MVYSCGGGDLNAVEILVQAVSSDINHFFFRRWEAEIFHSNRGSSGLSSKALKVQN